MKIIIDIDEENMVAVVHHGDSKPLTLLGASVTWSSGIRDVGVDDNGYTVREADGELSITVAGTKP